MRQLLDLLLPALFPSWRFFAEIAPSPRIEYAMEGGTWHEFRPRPQHLSVLQTFLNLFWSPIRNENLYLASLAERLIADPSPFCEAEIARLIGAQLKGSFRFRLVFVTQTAEAVGFTSEVLRP